MKCSLNSADSITYDNAYNEVYGAVSKYTEGITCPSSGYDCGAECETFYAPSGIQAYCRPKMSIIKAKLEADAYQPAAIHEGYVYDAHARKVCYGLNEASCKATDKECQYSITDGCETSNAHDLATVGNACPNTDFAALAALWNTTMSEAYQKSGITPQNILVTSGASRQYRFEWIFAFVLTLLNAR